MNLWKTVWERKGREADERLRRAPDQPLELNELLAWNGYDSAAATMTSARWLDYVDYIARRLGLSPGMNVCEVGCGAGALLWPLQQRGLNVWGVDYAQGLLDVCRGLMPEGHFALAEATQVPLEPGFFDAVWSNGVCIYFPDLRHAEAAFAEKVRLVKPRGTIGLFDLNDAAKKAEYAAIKIQALGAEAYRRAYADHPHLFYEKAWILDLAQRHGLKALIEDQALPGYPNSGFRFNALFRAA